jgi:hypothetical protein
VVEIGVTGEDAGGAAVEVNALVEVFLLDDLLELVGLASSCPKQPERSPSYSK